MNKVIENKNIKQFILIFFCINIFSLLFIGNIGATDYYVNASKACTGDGTSEANAWCSVANVSGASFNPGDNIYFARGEIWRETLTVPSSGNSTDQITFGAYGSGEKPIINGGTVAETWVDSGETNIYNKTFTNIPTVVVEDGTLLTFVDWDTDLATTAASMSAGTFTVNTTNNISYVWCTDNADPDTHTMEVSAETGDARIGIKCRDVSYITFDGLDVTQATSTNINVDSLAGVDVSNIIIQNCTSRYAGTNGITIQNWANLDAAHPITACLVDSCTVYENRQHGIQAAYHVTNSTISNNTVYNNGWGGDIYCNGRTWYNGME